MVYASEVLPFKVLIPSGADGPIEMLAEHSVLRFGIVDRPHAKALPGKWEAPGVYMLLDRLDFDGVWGAYVGKASPGGLRQRVLSHARSNAHWYRAILIRRDTEHPFHSGQAGWLEGHLYDLLAGSPLVRLHNGNRPQDLTVSSDDQISMRSYIPPIRSVLHLLGHRLTPPASSRARRRSNGERGSERPVGTTATELRSATDAPVSGVASFNGHMRTSPGKDEAPAARRRRSGTGKKKRHEVKLIDLISAGLLAPGAILVPASSAYTRTAVVNADGGVQFGKRACTSLSEPGQLQTGYPVNGWTFWKVRMPQGLVSLAALRRQLEERRADQSSSSPL